MKPHSFKNLLTTVMATLYSFLAFAQNKPVVPKEAPYVDFDSYEQLVAKVKQHRKSRLVTTATFVSLSKKANTIILDTRSDSAYAAVHVKGALHLNFSDFTQENLAKLIPSYDYTILIYCNNNFNITDINGSIVDEVRFAQVMATKSFVPAPVTRYVPMPLTLALNIPTYINLHGYGYRNVFELDELVNTHDGLIEFEGTAVKK